MTIRPFLIVQCSYVRERTGRKETIKEQARRRKHRQKRTIADYGTSIWIAEKRPRPNNGGVNSSLPGLYRFLDGPKDHFLFFGFSLELCQDCAARLKLKVRSSVTSHWHAGRQAGRQKN